MLTEAEQIRRGKMIADLLHLQRDADGRYKTDWGTKTDIGLFLTVKRIVEDGK